jgi:hypothetical protein
MYNSGGRRRRDRVGEVDIIGGATRVVTQTANATTAAGIRNGVSTGSHSTPAALLTLGAIGATGLVEWPVLLTIGGTALLVHQRNRDGDGDTKTAMPTSRPAKKAAKSAPRKSAKSRRR